MLEDHHIKDALRIRRVEEKFLELFSQGRLNGTVHTSVGQEFSAVAFAGQLLPGDFVFSNHRCHGHYLSFTRDLRGLIGELMGKRSGTCGGVGSSQHLCFENFFSNGIQGGIVPLAAGYGLAKKLRKEKHIGIVFIGDGTLGEGVLYETMNIVSKWQIPLMIVCENNFYAQSTAQQTSLAGDICKRAEAFGIQSRHADTWDVVNLLQASQQAIDEVRTTGEPLFFRVDTYRLNAHSKGDDDRDPAEIEEYRQKDFLHRLKNDKTEEYRRFLEPIDKEINDIVEELETEGELSLQQYYTPSAAAVEATWRPLEDTNLRQVQLLNQFFKHAMEADPGLLFIGEDVLSPYGGAFKVARDLSAMFPDRVFSTPISEGALTGISNGLALAGFRPFAEIMFGDFMTLAFDQIVNHAAKFHHMYNHKAKCPVVIRTPMGGRRGYGPTHSQTLDKFLIGIENVTTVALNCLVSPEVIYEAVLKEGHAVIVIENKSDYGRKVGRKPIKNYEYLVSDDAYPVVRICPVSSTPTATIVTYGGASSMLVDCLAKVFHDADIKPEVLVLSKISPLDCGAIVESVRVTGRLFVLEEGSVTGGIGSEIIATVSELIDTKITCARIGALPVPIPAVKSLEDQVLPSVYAIVETIKRFVK
jgi:2-oxoisovalerate dehydrogenase E1 component